MDREIERELSLQGLAESVEGGTGLQGQHGLAHNGREEVSVGRLGRAEGPRIITVEVERAVRHDAVKNGKAENGPGSRLDRLRAVHEPTRYTSRQLRLLDEPWRHAGFSRGTFATREFEVQ